MQRIGALPESSIVPSCSCFSPNDGVASTTRKTNVPFNVQSVQGMSPEDTHDYEDNPVGIRANRFLIL